MKFVASSSEILSHLQAVNRVIGSRNTLQILDCILFQLNDKLLTFTASDLETTIVSSVKLEKAEGEGSIAVPAKILIDTLRGFAEQPLVFDITPASGSLVINSGNGRYALTGLNGADFPQLPGLDPETQTEVQMPLELLVNGINKSVFATADDELRPVMNGILVELGDDFISFVASDAHKLVCYRRNDLSPASEAAFILPKKPANLLKNLVVKENATVKLAFDNKNALFTMAGHTLFCRLVEGKYPSYQTVIPKNNPNKLTIDRLEFCNSLKRVAVYANQASSLVKLDLTGNELVISAQDVDYSISATERLTCVYEGDPITIGFKAVFLIEILSNLSSPDVIFELSDPSRAGLLLPSQTDHEGEDVLMLLMPMMINA
ncbi:MAG: DNA polymerase III subunit beta [Bacteroidales bacterium]